jgi:hypothetical protein
MTITDKLTAAAAEVADEMGRYLPILADTVDRP